MGDIAIRVQNLSKQYTVEATRFRHDTLRDHVTDMIKWLVRRNGRPASGKRTFWALKDLSFEVEQGEAVGIIGRNGAGKSTLLKVLSRITEPTTGRADIYGRVGSLLEVGTGFDLELSGRENIYLSGAILGMRKAEIDRKFDEIMHFAEVDGFIDTPVKRYSSGMYVRLAFAVAAHLEPEILFVDEVLAVGDAAFQRKCLGKLGDVAKEGRTVLFVSHNMAAITRLCSKAMWLEGGSLKQQGAPAELVAGYLASGSEDVAEVTYADRPKAAPGSRDLRLRAIRVRTADGRISSSLDAGAPFTIEVEHEVLRRISNLRVGIRLKTSEGMVVLSSTDADGGQDVGERLPGIYVSRCTVPMDFLNFGHYSVSVGADTPMIESHFLLEGAVGFRIEETGGVAGHIPDGRPGVVRVRLPWEVERLA